jgi:hypothetical protein
MKAFLRISILINVLLGGYLLFRGGELFAADYFGTKEYAAEERSSGFLQPQEQVTDTDGLQVKADASDAAGTTEKSGTLQDSEKAQNIEKSDDTETADDTGAAIEHAEIYDPAQEPDSALAVSSGSVSSGSVSSNDPYFACILVQDGLLTVYDAQKRHVILYTDIELYDLPAQLQQEILDGKFVASQEELYHLLESYSS